MTSTFQYKNYNLLIEFTISDITDDTLVDTISACYFLYSAANKIAPGITFLRGKNTIVYLGITPHFL